MASIVGYFLLVPRAVGYRLLVMTFSVCGAFSLLCMPIASYFGTPKASTTFPEDLIITRTPFDILFPWRPLLVCEFLCMLLLLITACRVGLSSLSRPAAICGERLIFCSVRLRIRRVLHLKQMLVMRQCSLMILLFKNGLPLR